MSSGKGYRKGLSLIVSERGVTLLELLVTISIIGVVAVLTGFRTTAIEKHRLRQELVRLQTDIRLVRQVALNENIETRVVFDTENLMYYTQRKTSKGYVSYKTVTLSNCESIRINTKNRYVDYTARGTTGSACTISVFSRNYYGELTVNVGSGRVAIKKIDKI